MSVIFTDRCDQFTSIYMVKPTNCNKKHSKTSFHINFRNIKMPVILVFYIFFHIICLHYVTEKNKTNLYTSISTVIQYNLRNLQLLNIPKKNK